MTTAPPGWYANPVGDGERYWNGQAWTRNVRIPQPPAPVHVPPAPPPPPRPATPPPPSQPPPPGPQYQPLSYTDLGPPKRVIPRGVWWGVATFVGLGIVGAAISENTGPETSATASSQATTTVAAPTTQATPTPTEAPTTTAAPVEEPPPATELEPELLEAATFAFLGSDVNPLFSTAYLGDMQGTVDLIKPVADSMCEIAKNSTTDVMYTAALVPIWFQMDTATQALFVDAEGFGKASTILLNWRCPAELQRLLG